MFDSFRKVPCIDGIGSVSFEARKKSAAVSLDRESTTSGKEEAAASAVDRLAVFDNDLPQAKIKSRSSVLCDPNGKIAAE